MPDLPTLDALECRGKRILVRVDLNVPMKDGKVTDATRIERIVPTLRELADRQARVVILSHFDRPKGKVVPAMSLKPLVEPLGQALDGAKVLFAENCIGQETRRLIDTVPRGGFILLENLRFHPGEESNDAEFVAELAKNGDVYVNDAFSASHRAHASIDGIARLLPAIAGRGLEMEVAALSAALERPKRPLGAIIGGAKISTKLTLIGNLLDKTDALIIGGGMANTFLAAQGYNIGKSLCEPDMLDIARSILSRAESEFCSLILPSDVVVAPALAADQKTTVVSVENIPSDQMVLDIGPQSTLDLVLGLCSCASLVWNGPLGAFETEPFDHATNTIAREVARLTKAGKMLSVAGGGDTVAALAHAGVLKDFSYVSTAGGAFLEWLEGKILPGVAALLSSKNRRS